ncbi:4067_t:CDS:2, partial [Funneliformis mosseae]
DIQSCIDKVRPVRFGEHLNLFELEVTAYSSGYCLGAANWMIDCGGEKIAVISSSSTIPIHPLPFDEAVFNDVDVVILSDLRDGDSSRFENILMEIGQCVANTLKNKGNVLFPCTMNGIIFDIMDFLDQRLKAMRLCSIPFYAVSPIAEESLNYSNICGEWADSKLQEKYQEPCVIFAGHPSLRSGAVINFIRKWGNNANNSIIFIEPEYDYIEAMSAIEGLQIKPTYLQIDIRLTVNEYAERKEISTYANLHFQPSMADSNASAQLFPSHTGHANSNPPLSANYIPNPNPLQQSHNVLCFDIPGFKIIIIPVDNSTSNVVNNSSQQQQFNNYNNFSG